ncbi:hypothetical protein CROQUDRAFT_670040 [Cronartium quercuum f. sp. fusiforme G11]|uniref:Uncharacterized protein n=1 Tax=Cronartium quercuum f. sp. fusiforme G11 TaxID=708437 RepID=A0A9P6TDX0_9BASI|nr:hypothetical protein CROQUDRAFT_670040 [Cronartium quercuum f. sp. fusiforme G11]
MLPSGTKWRGQLPTHGPTLESELLDEGRIMLVSLNRPQGLNAMNDEMQDDLSRLFDHFEADVTIWVAILTGNSTGSVKAFCAGQDLKEWSKKSNQSQVDQLLENPNGFGSLSRRHSRKPIIAAVDGLCLGGGMELILNCDLVVATKNSLFGLPEVSKGVIASQGGIPRLLYQSGRVLASELLFLGKPISANEALNRFRIINRVVPSSNELLPAAMKLARQITANSPSAVQLSKLTLLETLRRGHEEFLNLTQLEKLKTEALKLGKGIEQSTVASILRDEFDDLCKSPDSKEGLKSFSEKRRPIWINPASRPASSNGKLSTSRHPKL